MSRLKIVIPTDFSEQSDFALQYARNLKSRFDIEILALHVQEVGAFTEINNSGHFEDMLGISTEILEEQMNAARKHMDELRKKERGTFDAFSTYIKIGPLTETIVAFAEKQKADLILMGTKGAEGLRSWISGSETQIVARRSHTPVMSVMCDRSRAEIEHLLLISDFSDPETAPDPVVTIMADVFNARLHLLCVEPDISQEESSIRRQIEAFAREHHLRNYEIHIHRDKNVLEGIRNFDQMSEMDVIALGTHGRKGIRHLLKGSIAEKLINHLHKPVIVYKI